MNDLIKKILQSDLPEEKLDALMKELMEKQFDDAHKADYEKYLLEELNVSRSVPTAKTTSIDKSKINWLKIGAIIAALCIGFLMIYLFFFKSITQEAQVKNYIADNVMYHQGTVRNDNTNSDQIRTTAYKALNTKNYQAAASLLQTIKTRTDEDSFYLAYAKLNLGDYQEALNLFSSIKSTLNKNEDFYEETRLYHAICQLMLQSKEADNILNELTPGSWSRMEFEKIIK